MTEPPPPLATKADLDQLKADYDTKLALLNEEVKELKQHQAFSADLAKAINDLPSILKTALEPLVSAAKGTAANKDDIIASAIEVLSGKIAQIRSIINRDRTSTPKRASAFGWDDLDLSVFKTLSSGVLFKHFPVGNIFKFLDKYYFDASKNINGQEFRIAFFITKVDERMLKVPNCNHWKENSDGTKTLKNRVEDFLGTLKSIVADTPEADLQSPRVMNSVNNAGSNQLSSPSVVAYFLLYSIAGVFALDMMQGLLPDAAISHAAFFDVAFERYFDIFSVLADSPENFKDKISIFDPLGYEYPCYNQKKQESTFSFSLINSNKNKTGTFFPNIDEVNAKLQAKYPSCFNSPISTVGRRDRIEEDAAAPVPANAAAAGHVSNSWGVLAKKKNQLCCLCPEYLDKAPRSISHNLSKCAFFSVSYDSASKETRIKPVGAAQLFNQDMIKARAFPGYLVYN